MDRRGAPATGGARAAAALPAIYEILKWHFEVKPQIEPRTAAAGVPAISEQAHRV